MKEVPNSYLSPMRDLPNGFSLYLTTDGNLSYIPTLSVTFIVTYVRQINPESDPGFWKERDDPDIC